LLSYQNKDKLLNSFGLELSAGRMESQFNPKEPIHPIVNLFTTFFLERNYMRLYEKDFLHLGIEKGFKEKLVFNLDVEYAERWNLENHSDLRLIDYKDRTYSPNIPL